MKFNPVIVLLATESTAVKTMKKVINKVAPS